MTHAQKKLIVGGLILACAVGYLGITGAQSGWVYFLDVDAYVLEARTVADTASKRARVHGIVAEEGVDVRPAELFARFDLKGETSVLPVEYNGPIPDLFKPGVEVVVEGACDARGVFVADVLMTKCASKYESDPGTHTAQGAM
jgi:cytochrome c-type biogenesis protein CcmE